jgi:hypothetical protein
MHILQNKEMCIKLVIKQVYNLSTFLKHKFNTTYFFKKSDVVSCYFLSDFTWIWSTVKKNIPPPAKYKISQKISGRFFTS